MRTKDHHLYDIWLQMRARCRRVSHQDYPRYGGRGIRVDPSWEDFWVFVADMGERPAGASLDRKNNDDHYRKDNCRWAIGAEQQRNRSSNVVIEHGGRRLCISEWAQALNIPKTTLVSRFARGWSIERALSAGGQIPTLGAH